MADCTKPEIVIEVPTNLPICDELILAIPPAYNGRFPDYPPLEAPPLCPCIYYTDTEQRDIETNPDEKFFDILSGASPDEFDISITMLNTKEDCCEPEYEFKVEADLPCMPFEINATIQEGSVEDETSPDPDDPFPYAYPGYPTITVTKNTGEDEFGVQQCSFDVDIEIPPQAEMAVKVVHSGAIEYTNSCSAPSSSNNGIKLTPTWEWNATLAVRQLVLTMQFDLEIPMISKVAAADDTVDTTLTLAPDQESGSAKLGPPE